MTVFEGSILYAHHRIPGGVTGDGTKTITELLETLNADPRRGELGSNAIRKRIYLDEEALKWLKEQNLSPAAIPSDGQFVRLRGAANVASGGETQAVLEQAHPDNLALAVRPARLLRLDLAGIDLLMHDISRSWLETGAAICEINAQPQLPPSAHAVLLKKLLNGGGRIPVVVILGQRLEDSWLEKPFALLMKKGCTVGLVTYSGVMIGRDWITKASIDTYQGGMALITDRRIQIALLAVTTPQMLDRGLPVDRFDALVVDNNPVENYQREQWLAAGRSLLPMCSGRVLANPASCLWNSLQQEGAKLIDTSTEDMSALLEQQILTDWRQAHRDHRPVCSNAYAGTSTECGDL